MHYVASGCISVGQYEFAERLGEIYRELSEVIGTYDPEEFAIEEVFVSRNAQSALKLGQARGVAIAAAVAAGLPIHEYAARHVKQRGRGHGPGEQGTGPTYGAGTTGSVGQAAGGCGRCACDRHCAMSILHA